MTITTSMKSEPESEVEQTFANLIETLRPSLKLWDYFVNWDKVFTNSKILEKHLIHWNSLLGSLNFDEDFRSLLKQRPEIVEALPALIVRDGKASKKYSIIDNIVNLTEAEFDFSKPATSTESIENALVFVKNSGLIKLFAKGRISNLNDYLIGVEAGLDSNARKNRSGTSMESLVEAYLQNFCKENSLLLKSQVTREELERDWNFDVPYFKAGRRYDFALSDDKKTHLLLIEVNFYGGGGSKLKATAGEYKELNAKLSESKSPIDFLWITDGDGWKTAKDPLKSAHSELDYLWNLSWLNKGNLRGLFKLTSNKDK